MGRLLVAFLMTGLPLPARNHRPDPEVFPVRQGRRPDALVDCRNHPQWSGSAFAPLLRLSNT